VFWFLVTKTIWQGKNYQFARPCEKCNRSRHTGKKTSCSKVVTSSMGHKAWKRMPQQGGPFIPLAFYYPTVIDPFKLFLLVRGPPEENFLRYGVSIWRTNKRRKQRWKTARFGARRNFEESTIWCLTQCDCFTKLELHCSNVAWWLWSPVLLVVTTLEQFYHLFLLVLEDFERCAMWDHKKLLQLSWVDGLSAGKERDFMVHHLGVGFKKKPCYWLLQAMGQTQAISLPESCK